MDKNDETKIPKVGISLLSYNQGKYLDDAIDSLKRQTYQNFEVYLADDGSNDGFTPNKIRSIDYVKIKTKIVDSRNLGNAMRRRELYKIINNDYILDYSADDILAPSFLEKTVAFLENHSDYGAVSVNIKLFENTLDECYAQQEYNEDFMKLPFLLANNRVLGSSLMRKKALDETDLSGGFVRYQDWDRWISMLEAGWKIGVVSEYLFYYRQVLDSLSHSASIEDEMDVRRKIIKKHLSSYKKYYRSVIESMNYAILWEQEENRNCTAKCNDLYKENCRLKEQVAQLENSRIVKIWRRIRRIIHKS